MQSSDIWERMIFIELEVLLYSFRKPQNSFLTKWKSNNLYTYWQTLRVFQVVSNEFSNWIFPVTLISQLIFLGNCDRLCTRCHS